MRIKDIFYTIRNDKTTWIYLSAIVIVIVFVVLVLLQPVSPQQNISDTPSKNTKSVQSDYFYLKATIPDNFTAKSDDSGTGLEVKSYSYTISNAPGTMKINIKAIPNNVDKIVNTGAANYDVPDPELSSNLVKVRTVESVDLFREDEYQKTYLAQQEYVRQDYEQYLTKDNILRFPIFAKTDDTKLPPYISTFKTSKNQQVQISISIDFTVGSDKVIQFVHDADTIIKSLDL